MWFWNVSSKLLLEVSAISYKSFIASFNSPSSSGLHNILQQPLQWDTILWVFFTQLITCLLYLIHQVAECQVWLFSVIQKLLSFLTCPHYPPQTSSLSLPVLWERAVLFTQARLHREPEFRDKCSLPPVLISLHFLCLRRQLMSCVRLFQATSDSSCFIKPLQTSSSMQVSPGNHKSTFWGKAREKVPETHNLQLGLVCPGPPTCLGFFNPDNVVHQPSTSLCSMVDLNQQHWKGL